ncbi:aminoglycoside phosphotransferase family protein [Rossellomorea aquimaris]|uniref:phosphotransferase n=1 Tax=Rossellomorea aquimaris TaxID=189382 RepID=UPI001CD2AAE1|nr:phosphotransferase [Rossellomorea aquimaris]MCA1056293.1 aminoglycoside phosphotransferase family protein [Rossellomorea aquimaris]
MTADQYPGGDDYTYRLLSFLMNKLNDYSMSLTEIKEGKWVLNTRGMKWFVKRYPNQSRFIMQETLTRMLIRQNFTHVIPFHPIHQREILIFEGHPIGLTAWLETSEPISYAKERDRKDVLTVLKRFHACTGNMEGKWLESLPKFKWLKKWKKRLIQFEHNIPFLQSFIQPYYLYTYLEWGKRTVEQLEALNMNKKPTCVTHGDVAHHNFLRGKNGVVYMIDFDLIALSTPLMDDLQFCNRILPFIDWSLNEIKQLEQYRQYHDHLYFYLGLLYPTDVFREWNRFFREGIDYKQRSWNYLIHLTVQQFPERMQFCQELQQEINRLLNP